MSVPLVGMETEYGIIREDMENSDPVEESMKAKVFLANGLTRRRTRIWICGVLR